ncbi:MAG: riboflavin synthase [Weeksellaceae bacterium]|nr:riboflavin synthase [Weeksellaceae bacterium]
MFTGIIESIGQVKRIEPKDSNLNIWIDCNFTNELKIDQSIAHNGVCLTVTEISGDEYCVTVIEETIKRTNLSELKPGSLVNLERCMRMNDRLDGHLVQGHIDQTAVLTAIEDRNGSRILYFEYDEAATGNVTVEKGSVCVNGISLTVVDSMPGKFSVAIIPYTLELTNLKDLKPNDRVNIEFDIIGKYIKRLMKS